MTPTPGVSLARIYIYLVKWFDVERAIGFGLLFSAGVIAFEPLRDGSLVQLLIDKTGLSPLIVSNWYLLAGLYLLAKGSKVSFAGLLLCVAPMMIIIVSAFAVAVYLGDSTVFIGGTDISREVFIGALVLQRLLSKLTLEIIHNIGGHDFGS